MLTKNKKKFILVLIGLPGAGKGTLSKYLVKKFNFVHLEPGYLLRQIIKSKSLLGDEIGNYINKGKLVPFEIISKLMKEEIIKNKNESLILDGFPRSIEQVKLLENILQENNMKLNFVIFIDVNEELAVERLCNRIICPNCNMIYNSNFNRPKIKNTCNDCGKKLIVRNDDHRENIFLRLKEYKKQTFPIVDYFKDNHKLITINAEKISNNYNIINNLLM